MTMMIKESDSHVIYIWDYNQTLPIAEISNGDVKEVAYTSFETSSQNRWEYNGIINTGVNLPTGKKYYTLGSGDITFQGTLQEGKTYIITYWADDDQVLLNGNPGTLLITKGNWKLYKHEWEYNGTPILISGNAAIDELRLYPKGSFMKTFTYQPGIGLSETSDINSIYQKYEYDGFNRLIRIRDWDKNILKQTEYGQPILPCAQPNADWRATSKLRCKYTFSHDLLTIIQEREEKDHNNCSITYNTKRWVSTGSPGDCPPDACLEPSSRWINGACVPGVRTSIVSVYQGNLLWACTFHYYWEQDHFTGPEQTTISDSPCAPLAIP